jgi:hypothetical protein
MSSRNWTFFVGYQGTRGLHLYRPIDVNSTDPVLLTTNLQKADATGLNFGSPLTVAVPSTPNGACAGGIPVFNVTTASGQPGGSIAFATPTGQPLAPGVLGLGYTGQNCSGAPVGLVGTPAFFNYFLPSGPNPSFAGLVPGGYATQVALASAAGFPTGFGVPVPFNSVDAQESTGSSWYNALTVNVSKHFSNHFELLSSYTWSHSIDDATDLQSTLEPQDSRFPFLERANSVNDQRHRWVTSGVFQTSPHTHGEGFMHAFLSNFTVAPLIELSSGRPFNVITGSDTRLDLGASRIGRRRAGPPLRHTFTAPRSASRNPVSRIMAVHSHSGITPPAGCIGNLGRDKFVMPFFFQFDLRVSKAINFGERFRLDLIADAFNLTNHTNIAAVNQLCDPSSGATCLAGQPTAAYDARQFQFALKFNW